MHSHIKCFNSSGKKAVEGDRKTKLAWRAAEVVAIIVKVVVSEFG